MKFMIKNKLDEKFLDELIQCKDPMVFLGVAKLLGIELLGTEKDLNDHLNPKDFFSILEEFPTRFSSLSRKRRREILKVLKEANKEKIVDAT